MKSMIDKFLCPIGMFLLNKVILYHPLVCGGHVCKVEAECIGKEAASQASLEEKCVKMITQCVGCWDLLGWCILVKYGGFEA